MEDYSGSNDIMLFGNDYINYSKFGKPGMYLFVRAIVENRFDRSDALKIKSITLLQDEKDKLIKKLSIVIPVSELTAALVEEFVALFKNNRGTATLQFDIVDDEQQHVSVKLFSKTNSIEVTQKLIDSVSDMKDINYIIN
jgi:DNA polymerase-3 subunit alpha